ncbi:MAG: DUF1611 domain-containing protein [Blastocatellia bacterium]|nr:DUF1611 domain-containing protein [Blastocatellia bacterium]
MFETSPLAGTGSRLGMGARMAARQGAAEAGRGLQSIAAEIRWSWACRALDLTAAYEIDERTSSAPASGDLVVARVAEIGAHSRIVTADNKRLRIHAGDVIVGVFGNRYATDAFEAEVQGIDNLSLLTGGGMIGTVLSRHREIGRPTSLEFLGFVRDARGERVNLKRRLFQGAMPRSAARNLIVVVGTSMNSGKTTACTKLLKGLVDQGLKVAACKLTGSVSNRDQDEMRSAAPAIVTDFSEYGFPSTYLCEERELVSLFHTMLADVEKTDPDVIVMEIADGLLQRETALLLREPSVRESIKGFLLTATSGMCGLYAAELLRGLNCNVIAVSGAMTSSPLAVREFEARCDVPVGSSAGSGRELTEIVLQFMGSRQ